MRKITAFLFASTLLATASIAATPAFDVGRVSQDVKTLSDDSFEGRAPATPAEVKRHR